MRITLHYLITLLLIGLYGTQVCPFIDSLPSSSLYLQLSVLLIFQYLLHHVGLRNWVQRHSKLHQVGRLFFLEWALFTQVSGLRRDNNYLSTY